MRVLVVNAFSREAVGDAALLSVMIGQVREAFPLSVIQISSLEDPAQFREFEGVENLGSSRRFGASETVPRYLRAARKLLVALLGSLWFSWRPGIWRYLAVLLPAELRSEVSAVWLADIVVSVGGGYLNGAAGLSGDLAVLNTLAPLRMTARLGKTLILGPQSYGPFGSSRQRNAVSKALSGASLILAREAVSRKLLAELSVPDQLLRLAVDSAFALGAGSDEGWREQFDVSPETVLVGMTARYWPVGGAQTLLEEALARLIDHIQGYPGFRVVLIPQVVSQLAGEDDRDVNLRIAEKCIGSPPLLIDRVFAPLQQKGLYACLDYVVGMRFHSVIFALTSGVPAIAIEYHHKAAGIMADLGLTEWVVRVDDLSDGSVEDMFDKLVVNRAAYVRSLEAVIPAFIRRAESVADMIREEGFRRQGVSEVQR